MKFIFTIAIIGLSLTSCTESPSPTTDPSEVENSTDSIKPIKTPEEKVCNNIDFFITEGWEILKTQKGDLNKDGIPDVALVVEEDDAANIIEEHGETINNNPRELIVLFGTSEKNCFELAVQNKTFILSDFSTTMDDPFEEMFIDKGLLKIDFHEFYSAGGWTFGKYRYVWRFQNGKFELIGADSHKFHRADGDAVDVSANFSTKKYSVTTYNMFDEAVEEKEEWKKMELNQLKTFETFKSPWTWEFNSEITF